MNLKPHWAHLVRWWRCCDHCGCKCQTERLVTIPSAWDKDKKVCQWCYDLFYAPRKSKWIPQEEALDQRREAARTRNNSAL